MNVNAVRTLIRSQMLLGELPDDKEHQLFGGKGDGACCSCCGQGISKDQVQYEVDVPTADGDETSFAMHMACYIAWRDECGPP